MSQTATPVDRRQSSPSKIADRFSLQIAIHSAIFGAEANADRAEEFEASAGNRADGHCPVRLRFVTRAAVPARSASQSRGNTARHPPCPRPLSRPAFRQDTPGISPTGMAGSPCRMARPCLPLLMAGFHDLDRGLYPSRRSRRDHPPQWSAMHFGQCTGLLLPPEALLFGRLLPPNQMPR